MKKGFKKSAKEKIEKKTGKKRKADVKKKEEEQETSAAEKDKFVPTFLVNKPRGESNEREVEQEASETSDEALTNEETVDGSEVDSSKDQTDPQEEQASEETMEDDIEEEVEVTTKSRFGSIMQNREGRQAVDPKEGETEEEEGDQKKTKKVFYVVVGILTVLIVVALVYMLYTRTVQTPGVTSTQDGSAVQLTVVDQLSQHVLLPQGEEPIVTTINELDMFTAVDTDFYANASIGQIIVIYTGANKVFLFDKGNDLVINIGTTAQLPEDLNLEDLRSQPQVEPATGTPSVSSLKIQLRNGTTASGLTLTLQKEIEGLGDSYEVVGRATADIKGYAETKLVDLTDSTNSALVNQLAEALNIEILTALPSGESETDVDIVIIVGEDRIT